MKRFIMLPVLLAAALALAATGLADPGDKGKGKNGKAKAKFTFTFTNTDNGSCGGQPWATLLETRKFTVKDNHDGTFTLTRRDKGTFTTIGGPSPGACETGSKHGKTVRTGVKGTFQGYLVGTVTAKSFNPKAPCPDVSVCETREGFLNTYFSPDRVYSCDVNSADCKFNYNYTAPNKGTNKTPKLLYRHWQDKGKGAGTMLNEVFKGDIANT
jgi:hypothetical protein